jgi:lipoate-protein ligase A
MGSSRTVRSGQCPSVGWEVHRSVGSAAEFHARPLPDPVVRAVHVLEVDRPALVLGSTQADGVADREACAAAGVEVVRRRSGGGAVLLEPGGALWLDVEVPRGDELWDDDVGRAAWWVGERCGALLDADAHVHRGGLVRTPWSDLVCFAGLGPGEVTVGRGGPKVLGLSQRRTRAGARFQVAVPLAWDPARIVRLLALSGADRARAAAELAGAARGVAVDAGDLVGALTA